MLGEGGEVPLARARPSASRVEGGADRGRHGGAGTMSGSGMKKTVASNKTSTSLKEQCLSGEAGLVDYKAPKVFLAPSSAEVAG